MKLKIVYVYIYPINQKNKYLSFICKYIILSYIDVD